MKAEPFVSAIIVAAGSGTRMGGVSKPLIKLGGTALISRVTAAFSACKYINEIIIVCRDTEELKPYVSVNTPVKYVIGGKTRSESVYNGVCAASDADIICIHDCARPFITVDDIEKLIDEAKVSGASCACTKVSDTIKYISEEEKCYYTPKRDNLIAVQTPQVFKKDIWTVSYFKALKDGIKVTDDTSLAEHSGFKVSFIQCSSLNMKLTTPDDIKIAKAICFLEEKSKNQ